MVLRAGCNKEIRSRYRKPGCPAGPSKLACGFPDSRRSRHLFQVTLKILKKPLLAGIACAIPQLKKNQITKHSSALRCSGANRGTGLRIAVSPQGIDPCRSVYENAFRHDSALPTHVTQFLMGEEFLECAKLLSQSLQALSAVEISNGGNNSLLLTSGSGVLHSIAKLFIRNINRRLHAHILASAGILRNLTKNPSLAILLKVKGQSLSHVFYPHSSKPARRHA